MLLSFIYDYNYWTSGFFGFCDVHGGLRGREARTHAPRDSRSVDRPLWFRFIADIVAGLSATKAAIKKPLSKIKNHLEIQSENEMYFQVVSLFRNSGFFLAMSYQRSKNHYHKSLKKHELRARRASERTHDVY